MRMDPLKRFVHVIRARSGLFQSSNTANGRPSAHPHPTPPPTPHCSRRRNCEQCEQLSLSRFSLCAASLRLGSIHFHSRTTCYVVVSSKRLFYFKSIRMCFIWNNLHWCLHIWMFLAGNIFLGMV